MSIDFLHKDWHFFLLFFGGRRPLKNGVDNVFKKWYNGENREENK